MYQPKEIKVKQILNKTKRRDLWFLDDYTINPFSACSFNCLYCYIRGSKYGPDMQQAVQVKSNAPILLSKALSDRAARGQYGIIVMSSATDPYLKIEEQLNLTRKLLETIAFYKFPVHVITKSPLVLRDLDMLKKIEQNAILPKDLQGKVKGALVSFSFSTVDDDLARIFEPGAPVPSLRIAAMRNLKATGITTGVSLMPLLPYITDTDQQLNRAFEIFKELNMDYVMPAGLSLFGDTKADSKTLMMRAVKKHFPELLPAYKRLFKDSNRLPKTYQQALEAKFSRLRIAHNLPNRIYSPS